MSGLLSVGIDDLVRHAGRTRPVADALDAAHGAVRRTGLPDGAFGLLCGFLPLALGPLASSTADSVRGSGVSVDGLADAVVAMARLYAEVDGDVHDRFVRLARRLP